MKTSGSILTAAIVGAAAPWLGLIAAALVWRWSSQTISGPAWDDAWLYTNMMLTMTILAISPMIMTNRVKGSATQTTAGMLWQMIVLLLAAAPILAAAGWLSQIHAAMAIHTILAQSALAIFAVGILAWIIQLHDPGRAVMTGLCAGVFLLPPGIRLIQASTFPWLDGGVWNTWITIFPASLIDRLCLSQMSSSGLYRLTGIYAAVGALMFIAAVILRRKKQTG